MDLVPDVNLTQILYTLKRVQTTTSKHPPFLKITMAIGDFNPIQPTSKDFIICVEGDKSLETFYCQYGLNLAEIMGKYKEQYRKITDGDKPLKIAVYSIDKIESVRNVGLDLI